MVVVVVGREESCEFGPFRQGHSKRYCQKSVPLGDTWGLECQRQEDLHFSLQGTKNRPASVTGSGVDKAWAGGKGGQTKEELGVGVCMLPVALPFTQSRVQAEGDRS